MSDQKRLRKEPQNNPTFESKILNNKNENSKRGKTKALSNIKE